MDDRISHIASCSPSLVVAVYLLIPVSANKIPTPSNKKRNPSKESGGGCAPGYSFLFGSCLFLFFNHLNDHPHGSLWNSADDKPTSIVFQLARYQLNGRTHILSCKAT